MAAEAHKVIRAPEPKPGAQEMSLAETIARMLEPLPLPQRLKVLKEAEKLVLETETVVSSEKEILRKLHRWGRAFAIAMPVRFSGLIGEYNLRLEGKVLVYERNMKGEVRVRKSGTAIRIPVPKWAYEAIGSPSYVRVRVEDGRIVVEPA